MSISSELLTLQNTKTAIRTAINNKGGSVGASDTFASYATAIDNLPSGGDDSTLRDLIEGDITSITIPSGTTKIRGYAFSSCPNLAGDITIPNTVTSIGDYAFASSSISSIIIPNSVAQYGYGSYMFNACRSLTSVTLPNNISGFPQSMFQNCSSLASITIPNTVTTFYNSVFSGCSSLSSITIPANVSSLGGSTFKDCSSLTSVTVLATTPPTLGTRAFDNTNNCPIYVPAASVDTYKAANNWSSYASRIQAIPTPTPTYYAKFTSSDSTINGQTFTGTNGVIGKNDLDNIIGSSQQDSRKSVTAVELTNLVTEISEEVFFNCTGLTSLTIPDSVTQLGNYAFENCSGLTNIIIGSGVTSIGDYCFGQLSNWPTAPTSVTVKATTPPTAGTGIFDEETSGDSPANSNLVIYVPAASVAAYQAASGWSAYASRIQAIPS